MGNAWIPIQDVCSTKAAQLLKMTRIGTSPRINRQSENTKENTYTRIDQGTNPSCVKSSNQLIYCIILAAADAFPYSSSNHASLSVWHNLGHFVTPVTLKKLTGKPSHFPSPGCLPTLGLWCDVSHLSVACRVQNSWCPQNQSSSCPQGSLQLPVAGWP